MYVISLLLRLYDMSDLQSSQSRVSYENMLACGWTQQNSVLGSPQLVCYDTILVFTSI